LCGELQLRFRERVYGAMQAWALASLMHRRVAGSQIVITWAFCWAFKWASDNVGTSGRNNVGTSGRNNIGTSDNIGTSGRNNIGTSDNGRHQQQHISNNVGTSGHNVGANESEQHDHHDACT